uniref:Uncharacterized protein n=1 Tax=Arundo donax TaxID=35708 RepID=A0A0A9H4K1_ARUDO
MVETIQMKIQEKQFCINNYVIKYVGSR